MKNIWDLIPKDEIIEVSGSRDPLLISGITDDSRKVEPGYLFIARRGCQHNGEVFIRDALERGAIAILRESPIEYGLSCVQIRIKNIKKVVGEIVLNFYDRPENRLKFVGITGTNGKSSTSFFLKSILSKMGIQVGYLGTLFYEVGERYPAEETTPSLIKIAPLLKRAEERGLNTIIMEVSSHALDQDRIYPLKFDVAVFTNLSRDHLDYHSTLENYYQAKKRLFTHYLKNEGKVVISFESEYGKRLAKELLEEKILDEDRLISVNDRCVQVKILSRDPGLTLRIETLKGVYEVKTNIFGDYQAKNIATLIGCAVALGFEEGEVIKYLRYLSSPPGRLELVGRKGSALIFVDYAHTPEALENALKSLLPFKKGRLIVLFGAGGNRDPGKRPLMGNVASSFSDMVILTSDNPRFEDPIKIIDDIRAGINEDVPYLVIPDRRLALQRAIEELKNGDILLVAGKGHETYQEIAGVKYPFSDQEEIKKFLERIS